VCPPKRSICRNLRLVAAAARLDSGSVALGEVASGLQPVRVSKRMEPDVATARGDRMVEPRVRVAFALEHGLIVARSMILTPGRQADLKSGSGMLLHPACSCIRHAPGKALVTGYARATLVTVSQVRVVTSFPKVFSMRVIKPPG
jgi:hypothetical protein